MSIVFSVNSLLFFFMETPSSFFVPFSSAGIACKSYFVEQEFSKCQLLKTYPLAFLDIDFMWLRVLVQTILVDL